jgi:hypothetical protein
MKSLFRQTSQSGEWSLSWEAGILPGTETAISLSVPLAEKTMKKICIAVAVAMTTLCATAPAFADYYHHRHCHWEWHHHHHVQVCH